MSSRPRSPGSKSPAKKKVPKLPARKKSKTPSRKASKSPARSQASPKKPPTPRARSRSTSRTPRKSPQVKTVVKSVVVKQQTVSDSPPKSTPSTSRKSSNASSRSRSSSRSAASKRPTSPLQVIKHKIQKATPDIFSSSRSRRGAADSNRYGHHNDVGGTTTSQTLRRVGPGLWQRVRLGTARFVRDVQRRFGYTNVKRNLKRNWRKYLATAAVIGAAYYTYNNQRYVQRALQEQYNKLAALIDQRKDSTFSKYFSGSHEEEEHVPPPTTEIPVIIRPLEVEEPPQPPHTHSTRVIV